MNCNSLQMAALMQPQTMTLTTLLDCGLTPQPLQPLQQYWQLLCIYCQKTIFGYVQYVHSNSLVNHGELCSDGACPVKWLYVRYLAVMFVGVGNSLVA